MKIDKINESMFDSSVYTIFLYFATLIIIISIVLIIHMRNLFSDELSCQDNDTNESINNDESSACFHVFIALAIVIGILSISIALSSFLRMNTIKNEYVISGQSKITNIDRDSDYFDRMQTLTIKKNNQKYYLDIPKYFDVSINDDIKIHKSKVQIDDRHFITNDGNTPIEDKDLEIIKK